MEFFKPEDFEGKALADFKAANELRGKNEALIAQIAQLTGSEPDTANAKIDFFMVGLVHAGVITKEQYADIVCSWEETCHKQLDGLAKSVVKRAQQAQREAQVRRGKGIATPQKGIVLPGGGVHKVPDKED